MKMNLQKRSHASRGGRLIAAMALGVIGISAVFLTGVLGWVAWLWFGVAFFGVLALLFWRAEEVEVAPELQLIEMTHAAIRSESERLAFKRDELGKVLMAYGEWMEFPDFNELRETSWATVAKSEQDDLVGDLLEEETERVIRHFSQGDYWEGGQFQHSLLVGETFTFVENIAKIYRPDSEKPLLETNLEAFLKAINRASLQIILLVEELPLLDIKEMNIRKVSERIRQASKVYKKYEELSPFLQPVRYLWQGSKLLLAANPLLAAGWIAGSELMARGGKKVGKKVIDNYVLSFVRQTLGIIAWETASIYDRTHRYRNPDFVFAVELAHLVSCFELSRDLLRETLTELGKLPLRSSYDRIFLYRCVAQHVSPKPEHFAQANILPEETRQQIGLRLAGFREEWVDECRDKDVINWQADVEKRLEISLDPGES